MAWTLDDFAALNKAIAGGTLKVKYQDREVTYRSLDELMRLRKVMAAELGLTSGKIKNFNPNYDSGLR